MSAAPDGALNPATVRDFAATIHAAAARALKGARDPGVLQLSVLHPGGRTMQSTRFPIGDVDAMVAAAISAAENGFNVYVEGRTVEARARGRGRAGETRGVFAFVDDADHDKGRGGSLALEPSLVVETSPGNKHSWLFLDRALTAEEADPIGRAMRVAIGSDSATAKLSQPYRFGGTPNYPDAKKLARGRTVTPTRILSSGGPVWTAAALVEAFPPVSEKPAGHVPGGRSGATSDTVEELAADTGPDRSERFFTAIRAAFRAAMLPADVEDVFRRYPNGCASKYLEPYDRLADEVARAWAKVSARAEHETAQPGIDPTYPDRAVHVAEARAAVRQTIADHLGAGSGYRAIRVATGVGKTRIAAELIAEDVRRRRRENNKLGFLYAVPRHKLGDEVAALFEANGITARVFRGRTADDPDASGAGVKMCLDVEAVTLALQLGMPVSTSCCKGKHPATGEVVTCPSFYDCSYQAQVRDRPDVWIVPHQILYQAQAALGDVAGVVIDESFWQAGIKTAGKGLTLDEVGAAPPIGGKWLDAAADVAAYRSRLASALHRQDGLGGVARRHLCAKGIDADLCTRAIAAEWKLKASVEIWPGMGRQARQVAAKAAAGTKRARTYAAIWNAARELLQREDGEAVSGRLVLAEADTEDGFGRARVVRTRGLRSIAKAWAEAPTLAMDATLPDLAILRQFYPEMEVVADIQAKMSHARVRQALGAPTTANKLMRSEAERNLGAVRRAILHRFLELGRAPTLVVAQQKPADWLRASGLPAGITVAHFNAIAGLDSFRDVRLLIVIGRTLPNVIEVEDTAGAITGLEVPKTAEPAKGGPRWYPKVIAGLRMRDGTGVAVEIDRHPDPTAEAVRWQICEAELVQAIGRARGVNRGAENPVDIEIWSDVVLPLTLDEVVQWERVRSGYEVEMAVDGIVLESPSDMAACWPGVWETENAARHWQRRTTSGQNPIETTSGQNPIKDLFNREMAACAFRYRHPGERQKWRKGWSDPAIVFDPKAWLEARLGSLAGFETMV